MVVYILFCREKVKIPYDKPYIVLKGRGNKITEVVWDDHETVAQSPTFTCLADNVIIKGISFRVRLHMHTRVYWVCLILPGLAWHENGILRKCLSPSSAHLFFI